MNFSSKLIEDAVNSFSTLPGVGKKSALRMVLSLLKSPPEATHDFTKSLTNLRDNIKDCKICHNISDDEVCNICSSPKRDKSLICVVEGIKDIMAIEDTHRFFGVYHVLGGVISPINGVGPDDLNISSLQDRCKSTEVKEVLMALSPNIEGDTTIYYITQKFSSLPIEFSTIARGVSFGGELENTDEITLGRSILARIPYK